MVDVIRAAAVGMLLLLAGASASRAATYTWTGNGADDQWSNAANWGGDGPANGETGVGLVFPALTGPYASHNDLTGLSLTSLSVATQLGDDDYGFSGNSIILSGAATMTSPSSGSPNLVWRIGLALGGDVTLTTSGRQTQLQAPVDLGTHTLTLETEGDLVLAGVISGSGNLIKNNGSALTIRGANTYTGSTTGNAGALYIANAAALGASSTGTVFNGGSLGFNGETFTTPEPVVFNGGAIVAYGAPTMSGQVTLNTTIGIQPFDAAAALTIGGPIAGPGGLAKTGLGVLILASPAAAYGGATTVEQGILRLDAQLAGSSTVTVRNGATLQGRGASAGAISVQDGGTLAPGASPGELTSAGLTMVAGATLAAEIDGASPGAQYDRLAVSGPVNLGGATLAVSLGYAPTDGQQFTLLAHQGSALSGTFAALPEGATLQVGATTFGITYRGGAGSDVVLVAGATPAPTQTPSGAAATHTPTPPVANATATPTPSPTPTSAGAACGGDCDGDGTVAINELVLGVGIALDTDPLSRCPAFDADGDARVTIAELIDAVDHALAGCPK